MPNYISFTAWEGFKPLAEFNSQRASHARIVILIYIALRSSSGYFWGEIKTVADDTSLTRGEAGRLIKDLENVGALETIAHTDIPKHIKKLIETQYKLRPAKKVWRVTGEFSVAGVTYTYEYTGDGGSNVGKVNIPNVQSPNCSLSDHNRVEESKDESSKDSAALPAALPPAEDSKPTRTSVSTKSPEYLALEAVVKERIFLGAPLDFQGGTICTYLVIQKATPVDVSAFCTWYTTEKTADLPREIMRTKGTDEFIGKFPSWWKTWELNHKTAPTPAAPAPKAKPKPGCEHCGGLGIINIFEGVGWRKKHVGTKPCSCVGGN